MKHSSLLYFSVLLFLVAISCRKDSIKNPPPPVEDPVSDARTILLKSIIEPGLPNPYFSLSYDANGFATGINFADNFQMYQVDYKNNRVDKVTNTKNPQTLQYYYTGKHVSYVSQVNLDGTKNNSYKLLYDQAGRLSSLQWFEFGNRPAARHCLAFARADRRR